VGGSGLTGFNLDSVYSAGIAAIGAIIALALYHAFSAAACCEGLGEPVSLLEHVPRNPHGDPERRLDFARHSIFVDLDRENQNARLTAVSNARHDRHRCCICPPQPN
jgi:hypothetical protein